MHANPFDRYLAGATILHQLDPRVKLMITLLFILANVLLSDGSWISFMYGWLLICYVCLIAKISLTYLLKRSIIALPFALAAITVIINVPGEIILTMQPGNLVLNVTDAGIIRFVSILLRSWLSVQAAILLVSTTPFPDLIHGLRHLRVPKIIVSIIAFMYRYLFVLVDETIRLIRAREARSARLDDNRVGGGLVWRARVTGNMVGQLFVRSYERSDRVYNAMLARGYQGEFLTISQHQLLGRDWNALLFAAILFLSMHLFALLLVN
jgi:cobalt/nickel transport system permease protein